ncbi:hypothetical protein [Kaistia granuli]|uniref:hypothetical protein n=1 Tax=Kaistia granuli TaxID=363259 RepID=UPI000367FF90|nr:hypothetical protein [Kaistia granuli]
MSDTREVKLEPTAEEIARVCNLIVQGLDRNDKYGDIARAILAMDRRASPPAEPVAWIEYGGRGRLGEPLNTKVHVGATRPTSWMGAIPVYASPPAPAVAVPGGLRELQAWVMAERIALVPLTPDFLPRYSTLKAVGAKIRAMLAAAPTPPAAEAPGQEPVYRFLKVGEIIQHGDENPDDQAHQWGPVMHQAIGWPVLPAHKTMRRLVSAPTTYADAEAMLRPMSEARKHGKEVVVATSNRAGLNGYLIAHWASDMSGSEQPPFEGWFYWTGHGFREIPEADLLGWCELPRIRSLASPAPKGGT